jgi:hypothetical protein
MIEVHYGVVQIESRWAIIGKGLRLGGYHTRADAEDVVRRIADQAAGLTVRLHLHDEDGTFHRD